MDDNVIELDLTDEEKQFILDLGMEYMIIMGVLNLSREDVFNILKQYKKEV